MKTLVESFTRRDKKGRSQRVRSFRRQAAKLKNKANAKILGEGKNGVVLDLGNRVRKEQKPRKFRRNSRYNIREAQIQEKAAKLGVAPKVLSYGKDFIEMEKIRGKTVQRSLATSNQRKQKSLGKKVAKSFSKLHKEGQIIHRDAHMDNVYLNRLGNTKIIDYGYARQRKRPLNKREILKDVNRVKNRAKDFPVFVESFENTYYKG